LPTCVGLLLELLILLLKLPLCLLGRRALPVALQHLPGILGSASSFPHALHASQRPLRRSLQLLLPGVHRLRGSQGMLVVSLQLLLSPQRQLVLVNRGFLLHLSRLLSLGALGELGLAGSVPGRLLARPPSSLLRAMQVLLQPRRRLFGCTLIRQLPDLLDMLRRQPRPQHLRHIKQLSLLAILLSLTVTVQPAARQLRPRHLRPVPDLRGGLQPLRPRLVQLLQLLHAGAHALSQPLTALHGRQRLLPLHLGAGSLRPGLRQRRLRLVPPHQTPSRAQILGHVLRSPSHRAGRPRDPGPQRRFAGSAVVQQLRVHPRRPRRPLPQQTIQPPLWPGTNPWLPQSGDLPPRP